MPIVRTVLGDVAPGDLGPTYAHEHLIIDSPRMAARSPEISLPSVDEAVAEASRCARAGVGAMVDAMPIGAGRNPEKLAAVAQSTGLHVVMATGLHLAMYYDDADPLHNADAPLVDWFVADLTVGVDRHDHRGSEIDRTAHRAGVIKVATGGETLTDRDRMVLDAAAAAHEATNAPILTHCEGGRGGVEQIDRLAEHGVDPAAVTLSHTDKVRDLEYHRELLASGVNVEYDQALRQAPDQERSTAWLVAEMVGAGHASQIMLGTDGARRSLWVTLGGAPGLDWLATDFVKELAQRGVEADTIEQLLSINPARAFSFEPAAG